MPSVWVDIELDEIDDDDLIREVIQRKLAGKVFAKATGGRDEALEIDPHDAADEIQALLTARHYGKAASEMTRFIRLLVPAQIAAAAEHIQNGQYNAAICELERFSRPSEAATLKRLPPKPQQVSQ